MTCGRRRHIRKHVEDADDGVWHRVQGSAAAEAWGRRTRRAEYDGHRHNLPIHLSVLAWFASGVSGRPDMRILGITGALVAFRAVRELVRRTPVPWIILTLKAARQARRGAGNLTFAAVQLNLRCEQLKHHGAQALLVRALTRLYLNSWDHDPEAALERLGDGSGMECCRTHSIRAPDCSMRASRKLLQLEDESTLLLRELVLQRQQRISGSGEDRIDRAVDSLSRAEKDGHADAWRLICRRLQENWQGSVEDLADAVDTLTAGAGQDEGSREKNRDTARS